MARKECKELTPDTEHYENKKIVLEGNANFAELAEEVHYGKAGAKAFFSSPYVFGAALLASMGGFSYGYGTQRVNSLSPVIRLLLTHVDQQIKA